MTRRGLRSKAGAAAVSLVAVVSVTAGCNEDGVGGLYGGDDEQAEENEEQNSED